VANALEESPFHTVRSLASASKILPTTVWQHLHSRGYVVGHLNIIPHTLSMAQKVARVESAVALKNVICSAKHQGWRYILTSDKSWFYFSNNPNHAWVPEGAAIPTRSRQTLSSPNQMLTVFWSSLGFPLVRMLPKARILMLTISARISLLMSIEFVQLPQRKMPDETFSYISTMHPFTLRLRLSIF
jgi:hypothetical protein